jgi:hypothetical protein
VTEEEFTAEARAKADHYRALLELPVVQASLRSVADYQQRIAELEFSPADPEERNPR